MAGRLATRCMGPGGLASLHNAHRALADRPSSANMAYRQ
jgi:hypothetical protein